MSVDMSHVDTLSSIFRPVRAAKLGARKAASTSAPNFCALFLLMTLAVL
jgi:hypothetical protein